jgi:hypothetical protein
MATTSRSGSRGSNRGRGSRNNNPEGRKRSSGMMNSARDNPFATAAAVGGALAAGVFLWSRRNKISDQIGKLTEQIGELRDSMGPARDFGGEDTAARGSFMANSGSAGRRRRTQAEISEEALTLKEIGKTV